MKRPDKASTHLPILSIKMLYERVAELRGEIEGNEQNRRNNQVVGGSKWSYRDDRLQERGDVLKSRLLIARIGLAILIELDDLPVLTSDS